MRTIHASLQEAEDTIGKVDARVILCDVLGVDRAFLVANPFHLLTETQDARVDMMVTQRQMGHPVAYLVGRREFYGRDFAVDANVLIPRPDTETLVEAALARLPNDECRVLDLGTGSGAIAVTLACERAQAKVVAVDASAGALGVARANAERHGAGRIEFLEGSWYSPVAGQRFDAIVANPPYVAAGDAHLGEGDLRFEPASALTDGSADGLGSIRAIIDGARDHLVDNGWLLIEHGYDQASAVASLLEAAGFNERESVKDLAAIPRVAIGRFGR
ncbi:peptide chain release factor N(5)-glutamine methyltransferase [Usitatibacter palustris]|uniref:Release factor glutamine methyltransferase n=1 Tax=Usitatibacter palustris TaxID=2732487 RepID=A0A6M4H293_9PROT|nr:peptide chain release factor N(5)-glutamine methyltransferase [Usitatibacter palustris]QJR13606.1 Release factor glutamine methyltransferase [Usitatibacter palustris]